MWRGCALFVFATILSLNCRRTISSTVAADEPTSYCNGNPCQNSDGIIYNHETRAQHNSLDNTQSPRSLESSEYEDYFINEVEEWISKRQTQIESSVLISYDSQGNVYPSTQYLYPDFLNTLRSMSVDGVGGGDDKIFFYTGQTDQKGIVHGLVNVAALIAHAMATSIRYDVCDEFNIDATDDTEKYAISNSCGQWGRSYQDEVCVGDDAPMTCEVNTDISMTAADSLKKENAPPPLECRPKASDTDFTGHWDAELGVLSEEFPYSNREGAFSVDGCCWWGR